MSGHNPKQYLQSEFEQVLVALGHDIKNHLTPLYLYIELLEKNALDKDKKSLNRIRRSSQAIEKHVSVVSELSKAITGTYTIQPTANTLDSIVEIIKQYSELIEYKHIFKAAEIKIDENLFKRVLNVLSSSCEVQDAAMFITQKNKQIVIECKTHVLANPIFSWLLIRSYLEIVLPLLTNRFSIDEIGDQITIQLEFEAV